MVVTISTVSEEMLQLDPLPHRLASYVARSTSRHHRNNHSMSRFNARMERWSRIYLHYAKDSILPAVNFLYLGFVSYFVAWPGDNYGNMRVYPLQKILVTKRNPGQGFALPRVRRTKLTQVKQCAQLEILREFSLGAACHKAILLVIRCLSSRSRLKNGDALRKPMRSLCIA